MLLVIIVAGVGGFLSSYTETIMRARIDRNMSYDLFLSVLNKDISFFDENKTGEIMSRMTSDIGTINHGLSSTFGMFLSNLIKIIISIIIMSYISWKLTLTLLAGVLPCSLLMLFFSTYMHKI